MSDPFSDWLRSNPAPMAVARGTTLDDIQLLHWNAALTRMLGVPEETDSSDSILAALARAMGIDEAGATVFAAENQRALREGRIETHWDFADANGKPLRALVEITALPSLGDDTFCTHVRDISAALQTQEDLAASEARFHDLFEAATDAFGFVALVDGAPTFIDCNAQLVRLFGAGDKADVLGKGPLDFSPPLQPDGTPSLQRTVTVAEQAFGDGFARFDWFSHRQDGAPFWLDVTLTLQPSWGDGVLHFSGRDVTDRKQSEQALARAEELARVTLQSIGDGIITTDADGRVTALNPIAERLTGWSQASALGQPLETVFRVMDAPSRQPIGSPLPSFLSDEPVIDLPTSSMLLNLDGSEYHIEESSAPIRLPDRTLAGAVIVFRDVTDTHRMAAEIAHQARHDPLTGLPNRREFEHRLGMLLEHAQSGDTEHALCYIDLDQFKVVNDGCGHAAGDTLLAELATLLQQQIRRGDLLARLGGDEFGLLLVDCPPEKAMQIANNLLSLIADFRFRWQERSFIIGASIGMVPVSAASASAVELMAEADLACFTAKDLGRNRVYQFRPGDAELSRRRRELQWAAELREALEEQRFLLFAQPIRALAATGSRPWYEILLRLRQRDGRIVLPGAFLPAAERFGLMPLIDRYVLDRVLGRLLRPDHAGGARLSVNLSGRSLDDASIVDALDGYFSNHRHPHDQLCVELTETTAVAHLGRTREFIDRLRGAGCRFALDDFGTGVSSFAYLKHLRVDYLKLDGSFVRDITREPIDHAMVESIHRLAQIMGFETIAEFVEDAATLDLLRQIGIHHGQGFLLGKPAPLENLLGQFMRVVGAG